MAFRSCKADAEGLGVSRTIKKARAVVAVESHSGCGCGSMFATIIHPKLVAL